MHFIFAIVVLLPVVLGVSLSEDLRIFSDSSANFFPVDTPTDSATSYLDNNNDDNLFADLPGPMDISSSEDGLDFLASDPSCLSSQQGQPSAKLRRQHADCAPNIQSSSSIDGLINTLGIFDSGSISETATGEESKLATTFPNVDVGTPCPGQFLGHLCCEYGGEIISQVNIVGTSLNVYSTMTNCDSVPITPTCFYPRTLEVCCEAVSYPPPTPALPWQQILKDMPILRERAGADLEVPDVQLYDDGELAMGLQDRYKLQGQKCVKWGKSQV